MRSSYFFRSLIIPILAFGISPIVDGATSIDLQSDIYLYDTNTDGVVFSLDNDSSWPGGGSAPDPTYFSVSGDDLILHGDVFIDKAGWATFDHGVNGSEVRMVGAKSCLENGSLQSCPIAGYLWSRYAGWIRFGDNPGGSQPDVIYDKVTGTIKGYAWNNQVGWISIDAISIWLTPIGPDTQPWSTKTFTSNQIASGSAFLPIDVPPSVSLTNTITLELSPVGYPSIRKTYTYDPVLGGFSAVDLTAATDYTYNIRVQDKNRPNSRTETNGILNVDPAEISLTLSPYIDGAGNTIIERLCLRNDPILCLDGNTPRPTHVNGDLGTAGSVSGDRYANLSDQYVGEIRLRDPFGNPIATGSDRTVRVEIGFNASLMRNSIIDAKLYPGDSDGVLDEAWRYYFAGSPNDPYLGPLFSNRVTTPNTQIALRSFAPSSEGNPDIAPGNDVSIDSVRVSIEPTSPLSLIADQDLEITQLFNTNNAVFKPLYEVSGFEGITDVQMGRPTTLTGTVIQNQANGVTRDVTVIHGLSIVLSGNLPNAAATFQDLSTFSKSPECSADYDGDTSDYVAGSYCERSTEFSPIEHEATVVAFRIDTNNTTDSASFVTIPRRILTVDLEQNYLYDSVITYLFDDPSLGELKQVTYTSMTQTTAPNTRDAIFANAVKILGQASGDQIYNTLSAVTQPKSYTLSRAELFSAIRKNITILTRNVSGFPYSNNGLNVIKGNADIDLTTNTHQSIVVYGDITITEGFSDPNLATNPTPPRAIIALKDDSGNGGNIYIRSNVTRIDATLITEGTLISGDPARNPVFYVDSRSATGIIDKQLYIYGSIFSQNTIGGAAKDQSPTCPKFVTVPCTGFVPLRYDLEHFRYYRSDVPANAAPLARGALSLDTIGKRSSLIIEFDPRIISTPPPGLENIR